MEEEIDLRVYVEVLIRYWKWIAGLALAAAVVAFAVSSFISPTYEATALAAITKPRYVMQFDPRFQTEDVTQPYKAYPELATSDDLLRDLMTKVDSLPKGVESLQDVRGMLEAKLGADPSLVQLVVSSHDPETAAYVANGWAELFVTQANEIYGAHGEGNVSFFEEQLTQAQAELDTANQALTEFQSRNQKAVLQAQLSSAQQDLGDYLVELRGIKRIVRNAQALRTSVAAQPGDALASAADGLTALQLQMQAFSVRAYSNDLPPIQLQVSDTALLSPELTVDELTASLDNLAATLKTWKEEAETQTAALEPQILALQQQIEETQAEENRLTRARDVARETQVTLAHKVEEAHIAAENTTGDVQLVSRAAAPEKPVSPRKLINTAVAGALGLMVGVFGAFAVEWWHEDEGQGNGDKGTRGDKVTR